MGTPVKSIAEAINDVTEDDVLDDDDGTEAVEEESTADDSTEEAPEEEAEEEPRTGDVEGEEQEEEEAPADEEPDAFDTLTPEEIAAIKQDPALNKLRKSLMRGYTTKTQEHAQLVQLGQAYRQNPAGVLKAIADSLGFQILPPGQQAPAAAQQQAPAPPADPGQDLENLFGPQIGPKVRAVFEKWAETRIGAAVAPVQQTVGQVVSTSEQARMFSEEQAFKARHKDVTPEIEKEVVALGNSGKIVPGDMSPAEYLDTLYDVVMARRARQAAKTATKSAATKLATKIESNRRDREPSGQSGRGGSVQKVSKISEAKSISEALDMAMAELENER